MWGVVILFVVLTAIVSLIALCYHSRRRNRQRRLLEAAAISAARAGGGGVVVRAGPMHDLSSLQQALPPGHRLGVIASDTPSGRHVILVGVPAGAAYSDAPPAAAAAAGLARARQLLPNGKLPTPQSVVANLPTYQYALPRAHARGGEGGDGGAGKVAPPSVDGGNSNGSAHGQVCVICCEDFQEGTRVKLLPCMHSFCADCIDAWLARDIHCPICKESVLRAAGMSEAEALELVISSANPGQAERRRQLDGPEAAAIMAAGANWGLLPGTGSGSMDPPHAQQQGALGQGGAGGSVGTAARAPDLQLQAQQQRLWQLGRQRRDLPQQQPPALQQAQSLQLQPQNSRGQQPPAPLAQ